MGIQGQRGSKGLRGSDSQRGAHVSYGMPCA
jgi:hypothetical protein